MASSRLHTLGWGPEELAPSTLAWAVVENDTVGPYGNDAARRASPDCIEIGSIAARQVAPLGAVVVDDETSRSHGINSGGSAAIRYRASSPLEAVLASIPLDESLSEMVEMNSTSHPQEEP